MTLYSTLKKSLVQRSKVEMGFWGSFPMKDIGFFASVVEIWLQRYWPKGWGKSWCWDSLLNKGIESSRLKTETFVGCQIACQHKWGCLVCQWYSNLLPSWFLPILPRFCLAGASSKKRGVLDRFETPSPYSMRCVGKWILVSRVVQLEKNKNKKLGDRVE